MKTENMKCPLCKRRKINEKDFDFIKHTGRCFKCDFEIHKEDMKNEYYKLIQQKDTMDISKHIHIPYIKESNKQ